MHFPTEASRKALLFFTVLASWTIGFGEKADDKTLNLKIGFDLTHGKNGAPALRIRDFEDSLEIDRNPRTDNKDESKEKDSKLSPSIRADSFSDSKEVRGDESSREDNAKSSRENSEDSGDESGRQRSTKGLSPGEYEPEENPKIHGRYQGDDDISGGEN